MLLVLHYEKGNFEQTFQNISAHLEGRVGNTEFDGFLARKLDVCFGKLILWLVAYGVKLLSDRKTLSFITDFFLLLMVVDYNT